MNKKVRILLTLALSTSILAAGCGSTRDQAGSEKTFTYGTMAYGPAMENVGTNPHDTYVGWSTLRYGIGETLFRFTENMQLEPCSPEITSSLTTTRSRSGSRTTSRSQTERR